MSEPADMIVPLLREKRAEIAASRAEVAAFRSETNERLAKLESGQRDLRSAMSGETILVDDFEQRVRELEARS